MKTFSLPEPRFDPYQGTPLPITKTIAVYYRQSTEIQVGNISTLLQTVDMVEYLKMLGWQPEHIMLIDLDRGISGTKGMRERPGMSILFDLIEHGEIGAVATQNVDRFFRELAQIETNIFVDACRRNNVLVLTQNLIYNFAHPMLGSFHIQMFREHAQQAADYREFFMKDRLQQARLYFAEHGQYIGHTIPFGYVVDMRVQLPDTSLNPNYRKYVRFQPWAEITLVHFEQFRANNGHLTNTLRAIKAEGLGFPEVTPDMIPFGFIGRNLRSSTSLVAGQLYLNIKIFAYMLTNVVYIGHWTHKDVITCWNNHEAIIPLDLFMYAFNRLSPTDFYGDPNPNYLSYNQWLRLEDKNRSEKQPTYRNLIFSNDELQHPHRKLNTRWSTDDKGYYYQLRGSSHKSFWRIKASSVDRNINDLLRDHLKEMLANHIVFDYNTSSPLDPNIVKTQQLEDAIRSNKQSQYKLRSMLDMLTNHEMIKYIEMSIENVNSQIMTLTAELEVASTNVITNYTENDLHNNIEHWETIDNQRKRMLFESVASDMLLTKLNSQTMHLEIYWRDGSRSDLDLPRRHN